MIDKEIMAELITRKETLKIRTTKDCLNKMVKLAEDITEADSFFTDMQKEITFYNGQLKKIRHKLVYAEVVRYIKALEELKAQYDIASNQLEKAGSSFDTLRDIANRL